MSQLDSWSDTWHGLREQMRLFISLTLRVRYICLRLVEECRSTRLRCNVIHGGILRSMIPSNRVLATSSNRVHTVHLATRSSPTPSTVLLYHICDVTRRQTVGSSYPRFKLTDVFLSTKSDRIAVLPLCTPISVLLNHARDVIRRQDVHNR